MTPRLAAGVGVVALTLALGDGLPLALTGALLSIGVAAVVMWGP